jgi:autotransporter-associated beta strand protein
VVVNQRLSRSVLAALLLAGAVVSNGASLTWDANTFTPGQQEGNGIWNLTGANWFNGASSVAWNNSLSNVAVFGGAGSGVYVVTVTAPVVTNAGLSFSPGATYALAGAGAMAFRAPAGTVTVLSAAATVGVSIVRGALVKQGTGRLVLRGANSYTGGTRIAAGVLQLGSGDAAGSLAGDIVNDAAWVVDRAGTLNYGGALSGTGTLVKAGSGSLILSGSGPFSGTTVISNGALVVNGSLQGSDIDVRAGASLFGTGAVRGVAVSGTVHAGAEAGAAGLLSVGGALSLGSGGEYAWDLLDASAGAGEGRDLISVGDGEGTVTVNAASADPFVVRVAGNASNMAFGAPTNWILADAGAVSGFASNAFAVDASAFPVSARFRVAEQGGDLVLAYEPTPDLIVLGANGAPIAAGDAAPAMADGTDFGPVALGGHRSTGFAVTNRGGLVLGVAGAAIVGASNSPFSVTGYPAAVPPGAVSNVLVRFAPVTPGAHTAAVEIASDDPDTPAYSFALRGYGALAAIGVAPGRIVVTGEVAGVFTAGVVQVSNEGADSMAYSLFDDADWLTAGPPENGDFEQGRRVSGRQTDLVPGWRYVDRSTNTEVAEAGYQPDGSWTPRPAVSNGYFHLGRGSEIVQITARPVEAGRRYRLTMALKNVSTSYAVYEVAFTDGSTNDLVFASTNAYASSLGVANGAGGSIGPAGSDAFAAFEFTAEPGDPFLGSNLGIRIASVRNLSTAYGAVDDVQLTAVLSGAQAFDHPVVIAPAESAGCLPAGSYTGRLTVASDVAGNSPRTIEVVAVLTNPAQAIAGFVAAADGSELVRLSWADTNRVLIVYRPGEPPAADAADCTVYSNGAAVGGGAVIFTGEGSGLEHVVSPGTSHHYRLQPVLAGRLYGPAVDAAVETPPQADVGVIDTFSYTNGVSIGGQMGGQGWTSPWLIWSGDYFASTSRFVPIDGYPAPEGNCITNVPSSVTPHIFLRDFAPVSTGRLYFGFMVRYGGDGEAIAGFNLFESEFLRVFVGNIGDGEYAFGIATNGTVSGIDLGPGSMAPEVDYTVVGMYDLDGQVVRANLYTNGVETVPATEPAPGAWELSLAFGAMTSVGTIRLDTSLTATSRWDSLRLASSWSNLLAAPLLMDSDGDGLSDGQEGVLGTNRLLADTDGDGAGDGDEVVAGSDPLNPASAGFRIARETKSGAHVVLAWPGVSNRVYSVYAATNLMSGANWVPLDTNVAAQVPLTTFATPPAGGGESYRIQVRKP